MGCLSLIDFCFKQPEMSLHICSKCSIILESVDTGLNDCNGKVVWLAQTLHSRLSPLGVEPLDSPCYLVALVSNPKNSVGNCPSDVELQETHLFVNP